MQNRLSSSSARLGRLFVIAFSAAVLSAPPRCRLRIEVVESRPAPMIDV